MNSTPQTESRDNSREIPGLPGEYVAGLVDGEGCLSRWGIGGPGTCWGVASDFTTRGNRSLRS